MWDAAEEEAAGRKPREEDELKCLLTQVCMLLVCHETGAERYSSPLVSFCAMLSIRPATLGWQSRGDLSSYLSGIVWVVQLLIFCDSSRRANEGQSTTLDSVKRSCRRFMQQTVETPMGEILRWRLLLFQVSKSEVSVRQAIWDEREEVLTYEDTELHMEHIPKLLVSEYTECRQLHYNDLMFGITALRPMHVRLLKDNPSVDIVGWDFTQHRDNTSILEGADSALLNAIERSERLNGLFTVRKAHDNGRLGWRASAIATYENTVQEFLKRLAVLFHIHSGTPVRETEFFAMTWWNTQRRRSITLQHDRVMIHVQYHKGQQQSGSFKENIRFLADPIADLFLDYVVYVMHLRQIFLRDASPRALISPYLWVKDNKVWPDGRLSRCLEDASARARVPRLHISNWRQMTVAIVKTKFCNDISCFEVDPDDEDGEEMDNDIRIMTRQRNHKTRTVNRAYANQTGATFGNVWDGLIRMGLRASNLWQDFWGVDTILRSRKREHADDIPRMAKRIAMGVYRPKKACSLEALLGALRELTILVVPLVSLCGDLIRRLQELQIEYPEWLPGERREAGLVLVSVEASSTRDFLTYAQTLVSQQKLDRIVMNECHLTVTAARYRESTHAHGVIRSLRTEFVYLTATLPPFMQAESN